MRAINSQVNAVLQHIKHTCLQTILCFFICHFFFGSEKHRCISYMFVLKFHLCKSLYQNRCYFNGHNCRCPNLAKPGHHSITSKKWYLCKCLNVAICGHQSNLRECPNLVNSGQNLPAMVSFKIFLNWKIVACLRWRYRIGLCHAFCDLYDDSSDNWRDGVPHLFRVRLKERVEQRDVSLKIKLVVLSKSTAIKQS